MVAIGAARPGHGPEDAWEETRQCVVIRLADHGLRRYDRWAFSQLAKFLSGRAPDPDSHAARGAATLPLSWRMDD